MAVGAANAAAKGPGDDGQMQPLAAASNSKRGGAGAAQGSLASFAALLRLMMPTLWSVEGGLLAVHTVTLVARTALSTVVARLDGRVVKAIVDRDAGAFRAAVATWLAIALPSTFVNSLIRFLERRLSLAFRSNLTRYFHRKYMASMAFYRVKDDPRAGAIEQCLTDDVTTLCAQTAHIYNHVTKPLLDIVVVCTILVRRNVRALKRGPGGRGAGSTLAFAMAPLALAAAVIGVSSTVLRVASPPFGRQAAARSRAIGELRALHSRVAAHAEEIALLRGERAEEARLADRFAAVAAHERLFAQARLYFVTVEQFFLKYVWSAAGNVMVAAPLLLSAAGGGDDDDGGGGGITGSSTVSDRAMEYTESSRLLADGAGAIKRLLTAHKEVSELSGHVERVHELDRLLKGAARGSGGGGAEDGRATLLTGQPAIFFDGVGLSTPLGDRLTRPFSFRIEPGQHTVVVGPNGCGKSTLLRVLAGLRAGDGGVVGVPDSVVILPQRPYVADAGPLRDQVTYPASAAEAAARGWTDADVLGALDAVGLADVAQRESGLDAERDWSELLSGGERQQLAVARLLLHRPAFALLDEATSAMTAGNENKAFAAVQALGATLVTVTHHNRLRRFHTHELRFDGEGGVDLARVPLPAGGERRHR